MVGVDGGGFGGLDWVWGLRLWEAVAGVGFSFGEALLIGVALIVDELAGFAFIAHPGIG